MTPEERREDRGARKPRPVEEPFSVLMPVLQHGSHLSFWEDELRLDLAQEDALARIEGRDPAEAVEHYRLREKRWYNLTCPLLFDGD
jgi:hypothetical protein